MITTKKGYETLSRQAIKRGLFPRLFVGDGPGEANESNQLDEDWAVVWTNDTLVKAEAKLGSLPVEQYGGLRHTVALIGASWTYGL